MQAGVTPPAAASVTPKWAGGSRGGIPSRAQNPPFRLVVFQKKTAPKGSDGDNDLAIRSATRARSLPSQGAP